MPGKEQIVEELGDLLLPNLVNQGLVANDRAKFLLTLLQTSREHADHPNGGFTSLKQDQADCGIEDPAFYTLVQRSERVTSGNYRMPEVGRVHQALVDNVRMMLAPIEAETTAAEVDEGQASDYQRRFGLLTAQAPSLENDLISGAYIDRLTAIDATAGDSLHLLIMNLHKELNRIQQKIAAQSIDGAQVYGIAEEDRPKISAFMRGVNRTRMLKFDHPGLATTATRTEGKLVIQNDVGTTDAHVLVIHVTDTQVAVTYTDVHIQRLLFFQNLLKSFAVRWDDTRSRHSQRLTESLYHLSVGRYTCENDKQQEEYLEYLGSRLVFLIDWNRARKRLQKLAPKRVSLQVLQWAAKNDFGHMAFLLAGGEQLVFDALQLSSRDSLRLGGQLSDIIGADRAAEFLKFTLKTASEGLLAGHSELLIRDQVRAELRHYLDTAHQGQLAFAAEHAELIVELATAARDCLLPSAGHIDDAAYTQRAARRAKQWEHQADELVTKSRRTASPGRMESKAVAELLQVADDAADDLEEGVFLHTLFEQFSVSVKTECRELMRELAELLVGSAQEYLKAVENARHISRGSSREEMGDFLTAIDNTISLEHETDDAHRRSKANILACARDYKQLHLFSELAARLESASDAIMRASLMLRDYILAEVITR